MEVRHPTENHEKGLKIGNLQNVITSKWNVRTYNSKTKVQVDCKASPQADRNRGAEEFPISQDGGISSLNRNVLLGEEQPVPLSPACHTLH